MIRIFWLWSEVSDCDQKFLIAIRSFWLWSELSDCDQNFLIVIQKNPNQNFLITIRKFWLWSENSLNKRCFFSILVMFDAKLRKKTLIEWIFWSQSEFSDCEQNFLIVIKLKKTNAYWEINKSERPKTTNKDLKQFFASTDPPRHINPGTHSGILLSVISSGVASAVLSGIKYGVLSGKSFANFTWQKFWRSVWHTFWSDWWKVRLLKICRVWVSCREVFTHRMEEQYDI